MKLIIIRHGDPDYSIDSLTEKGWKEAEYLADRIAKLDVKQFYVSRAGGKRHRISHPAKNEPYLQLNVNGCGNLLRSLTVRTVQTLRYAGTGFRVTGQKKRIFTVMTAGPKSQR